MCQNFFSTHRNIKTFGFPFNSDNISTAKIAQKTPSSTLHCIWERWKTRLIKIEFDEFQLNIYTILSAHIKPSAPRENSNNVALYLDILLNIFPNHVIQPQRQREVNGNVGGKIRETKLINSRVQKMKSKYYDTQH